LGSHYRIGTDARHGDGVGGCLVAETSRQGCLPGNVGGLDLLDNAAIDNIVNELLVQAVLLQQRPVD